MDACTVTPDGSSLGWFSQKSPSLEPCMGRLIVRSIYQLGYNQPAVFYMQLLQAAVIALAIITVFFWR